MNRKTKFRGKTIHGKWITGCLVYSEKIQPAIYFEVGEGAVKSFEWSYVQPDSVGQYTELKDKKGIDIFEGDTDGFNTVSFENGCFNLKNKVVTYGLLSKFIDGFTIVGNLYDNPELIENKDSRIKCA